MAAYDWFEEFIRVTSPKLDMLSAMDRSLDHFFHEKRGKRGADLMGRRSRQPRLKPTKGYRGAHKHFKGGSR